MSKSIFFLSESISACSKALISLSFLLVPLQTGLHFAEMGNVRAGVRLSCARVVELVDTRDFRGERACGLRLDESALAERPNGRIGLYAGIPEYPGGAGR